MNDADIESLIEEVAIDKAGEFREKENVALSYDKILEGVEKRKVDLSYIMFSKEECRGLKNLLKCLFKGDRKEIRRLFLIETDMGYEYFKKFCGLLLRKLKEE